MGVEVGHKAPDFELKDQTGQPVRLSDYHGKKAVVLVFYSLTFTSVCETELCGIRDELDVFRNEHVETLAVSVDAPPVHRMWAEQQGYEFPILSDFWPHGEVAGRYGVFDEELGVATRATFVLDTEGTVTYRAVNPIAEPRDREAWKRALRELGVA